MKTCFWKVENVLELVGLLDMHLCIFGVFVLNNFTFNAFIGFGVKPFVICSKKDHLVTPRENKVNEGRRTRTDDDGRRATTDDDGRRRRRLLIQIIENHLKIVFP